MEGTDLTGTGPWGYVYIYTEIYKLMYNVINRRVHVYTLADNAQACVCDSATGPVPAGSAKALCETLQKHVTIEAGDHWTETDPETLLTEFADFHARAKSGVACTYTYLHTRLEKLRPHWLTVRMPCATPW